MRMALPRPIVLVLTLVVAFMVLTPFAEATAKERLVLAFGDSLTAGYGLKAGESFPSRLESLLRADGQKVRVHNAGVSGDTTSGGKARLARVVKGLPRKPDLVILELGANDMMLGLSPATTEANLDAMLGDFKTRGIPVVLAGMFSDQPVGFTYFDQYNGIYPRLAKKHGVTLYPFFMKDVAFNSAYLLKDGLHPNAKGVELIARNIYPTVKAELLKKP